MEAGEKNNVFFLGLEKNRQSKNIISKLKVEDKIIENQNVIMKKIGKYYKNLYSSKNIDDEEIEAYLKEVKHLYKLDEKRKNNLEKSITEEEIKKKNKSHGLDGLTNEFYQNFWSILEDTYYKMLNLK